MNRNCTLDRPSLPYSLLKLNHQAVTRLRRALGPIEAEPLPGHPPVVPAEEDCEECECEERRVRQSEAPMAYRRVRSNRAAGADKPPQASPRTGDHLSGGCRAH